MSKNSSSPFFFFSIHSLYDFYFSNNDHIDISYINYTIVSSHESIFYYSFQVFEKLKNKTIEYLNKYLSSYRWQLLNAGIIHFFLHPYIVTLVTLRREEKKGKGELHYFFLFSFLVHHHIQSRSIECIVNLT